MRIRLAKGSHRNTKCYVLCLGSHELYWSYETCIAYWGPAGRARIENYWGPTTGRHMNEMGVKDWPVMGDSEFSRLLDTALAGLRPSEPAEPEPEKQDRPEVTRRIIVPALPGVDA